MYSIHRIHGSGGPDVLGLSAYQLRERRTTTAVFYEFFDAETGQVVGLARFDTQRPEKTSRIVAFQRSLFDSPSLRWLGVLLALIIIPFAILGAILGLLSTHPQRQKPRLVVHPPESEDAILMIRQSSGMFYDSRVVHDGRGQAIAQFRGPSKIALGRMSFGMIDLGGTNEAARDYGDLPWLGWVNPSDEGVFRVSLVGVPNAGRVVEHRTSTDPAQGTAGYDIEAGPSLRDNPKGMILLLATALALAWRPPPG